MPYYGRLPAFRAEDQRGDEWPGMCHGGGLKGQQRLRARKAPRRLVQVGVLFIWQGGKLGGELKDLTIDKLSFLDVAHVIAVPLASQKYLPARDPNTAKLLIMVYWGTTAVPEPASESVPLQVFREAQTKLDQITLKLPSGKQIVGGGGYADSVLAEWSSAMSMLNLVNQQRTRTNFLNAAMLGYDAPGLIGTDYGNFVRARRLASSGTTLCQKSKRTAISWS